MKKKKQEVANEQQQSAVPIAPDLPVWTLPVIAAAITFLVFMPVFKNGFINLDDNAYIYENPLVTDSFSFSGLIKVFSSYAVGNYHPLTILLLNLINTFFGNAPGAFHFFSLALHTGSVIVLFYFFWRLTRKPLAAFIVAVLFGIHPLHVEPVVWASSFKDVLYVFFYACAMCTYLVYIQEKRKSFLLYTAIFFLLSLLSKGMAVTLPVTLVLIDVYTDKGKLWNWNSISFPLIAREKLPFFLFAVAFGIVAFIAQKSGGAVNMQEAGVNYSAFEKWISIPAFALCGYLFKFITPLNLSAFYAYPPQVSIIYPLLVILLVALLAWRFRNNKTIMFGVLFFLVNIVLVLQIIPVGGAVMADRYTYLSMVGLFFIVGVSIEEYFQRGSKSAKQLTKAIVVIFLVLLAGLSYSRVKVWRDSKKLWYSALEENPDNYFVHGGMGELFLREANPDSALFHLRTALYIFPYNAPALHNSLASAFLLADQLDSAIAHSAAALNYNSSLTKAYETRGEAYIRKQMPMEALNDFHKALKLAPSDLPGMYLNMGVAYGQTGKVDSAILYFTQSIGVSSALDSVASIAYINRSLSYSIKGDLPKALEDAYIARSKGRILNEQYIPELEQKLIRFATQAK